MSTRDAKHVVQLTVLVLMFLDIAIFTGLYESDVSSVRFGDLCNLRFFQWWSRQMVAPLEASSVGQHPRGSANQKGIQEYQKVFHLFSSLVSWWPRWKGIFVPNSIFNPFSFSFQFSELCRVFCRFLFSSFSSSSSLPWCSSSSSPTKKLTEFLSFRKLTDSHILLWVIHPKI